MMYISVYPVVITMRHSNIYEERSLGVYAEDELPDADPERADSSSTELRSRGDGGMAATLGRAVRRTFTWYEQSIGVPHTHMPLSRKSDGSWHSPFAAEFAAIQSKAAIL